MPPAARVKDLHTCPMTDGPKPHVGGPVMPGGDPTVLIGYLPAARVGDHAVCVGPMDTISQGDSSVLIGNRPPARLGDMTQHGGVITGGCFTVIIGSTPQAEALRTNKPFCAECAGNERKGGRK